MSKTYEPAGPEVQERVDYLIETYHEDLYKSGVKIVLMFAMNPEGDAIMHQGYKAIAVVRKLSLKHRAMGRGDAEIEIDKDAYLDMDDEARYALLDHELEHLVVAKDDDGKTKTDDLNRPVLKMKKHDTQVGWFSNIAARWGRHSMEVKQCKKVFMSYRQEYFSFIDGPPGIRIGPGAEPAHLDADLMRHRELAPVVEAALDRATSSK